MRLRWVLVDSAAGMPHDGRIGSSRVMAVVRRVARPVRSVAGLYDLRGTAGALRAVR